MKLKFSKEDAQEARIRFLTTFMKHGLISEARYGVIESNNISSPVSGPDEYDSIIKSIIADFDTAEMNRAERRYAFACLRWTAEKVQTLRKFKAALPNVPVKFVEPYSYRTKEWFAKSTPAYTWDKEFVELINSVTKNTEFTKLKWLGLTLYSAMTRGAMFDQRTIRGFIKLLVETNAPLKSIGDTAYLEFDTIIDIGHYNVFSKSGETVERRRWYPDTVTLTLIIKFLSTCQDEEAYQKFKKGFLTPITKNTKGGKRKKPKELLFPLIQKAINIEVLKKSPIKSLTGLGNAAIWVVTSVLKIEISEALINIAAHNTQSFCASNSSLKAFYRLPQTNDKQVSHSNRPQVIQKDSNAELDKEKEFNHRSLTIFKSITNALKKKNHMGHDYSSTDIQIKLKNIDRTSVPKGLLLILDWLISCCEDNSAGSIRRYARSIMKVWFPVALMQELTQLSATDLLNAYQNMIDRNLNIKTIDDTMRYIKRAHQFGMQHKDYPLPYIENLSAINTRGEGGKKRVRTDVISHHHIKEALDKILLEAQYNEDLKAIALIVIFAYRLGLREGEILKIQLNDIEPNGEWLVLIKNNIFSDNKSSSSERVLSLKALLHPDEFEAVMVYYTERQSEALNIDHLLFGTSRMNLPIQESDIYKYAIKALKEVTGCSDTVLHSLRHSAASIFQAVFEEEYELAHMISGLSIHQLKEIRTLYVGSEEITKRIYWDLAAMLGHSAPSTSIAKYSHLSDLILYNKLQKHTPNIHAKALAGLVGKASNTVRIDEHTKVVGYLIRNSSKHFNEQHDYIKPGDIYSNGGLKDKVRGHDYKPSKIHTMLHSYDLGETKHAAIQNSGITISQAEQYFKNSKHQSSANTSHKKSKIADKKKRKRLEKNALIRVCPQQAKDADCRKDAALILEQFIKADFEDKTVKLHPATVKKATEWSKVGFAKLKASTSGFRFNTPEEMKSFILKMGSIFPSTRWRVEVYFNDPGKKSTAKKNWKNTFPKMTPIKKKISSPGSEDNEKTVYGMLYLRHTREEEIVAKQNEKAKLKAKSLNRDVRNNELYKHYSSDGLKYAIQMLMIIFCKNT